MIETAPGKTFKATLSHFSELIIGDENDSSKFNPHIRVKKWGEEGYLAFGPPNSKNFAASLSFDERLQTTVVNWLDTDADRLHRFYTLPADGDHYEFGGLEYRIRLSAPPSELFMDMPCDLRGLDLHYQPALTEFEVKRGAVRPPNVVGAYVAMHRTAQFAHGSPQDADKYRCGIAFTIYRPKAIDARGAEQWLDLVHDPIENRLRLLLDPAWFASAAYPVEIDPDIGYNTLGGSNDPGAGGYYSFANLYAVGGSNFTLANAYFGGSHGSTGTAYVGVYDEGDGDISSNNRLAASAAITITSTPGFRTAAISGTLTASTNILLEAYNANGNGVFMNYTATGGVTLQYTATIGGAATPPDPHIARGGTVPNWQASVYVDGTTGGGGGFFGSPVMSLLAGYGNV